LTLGLGVSDLPTPSDLPSLNPGIVQQLVQQPAANAGERLLAKTDSVHIPFEPKQILAEKHAL